MASPFPQRLFVFGSKPFFLQVQGYMPETGQKVSQLEPEHYSILSEVYGLVKEGHSAPLVILQLSHVPHDEQGLVKAMLYHAPVVGVSDNRALNSSFRNDGLSIFAPETELSANNLDYALQNAWSHFQEVKTLGALESSQGATAARLNDIAARFLDWLWEVDKDLNLIYVSDGRQPGQRQSGAQKLPDLFLDEERPRIEADFKALFNEPRTFEGKEYWTVDYLHNRQCWSLSGTPVLDADGNIVGYRCVGQDISEQRSSADQLFQLAHYDSLTGAFNRQRLFDEMARTLRQASREHSEGLLVLINIDHFAYVNETYGHTCGDQLLTHMVQILKDNVRNEDVVARTAGDEFALILRDVAEADRAFRLDQLRLAIENRPLPLKDEQLPFNVSIGAVPYTHLTSELVHPEQETLEAVDQIFANAVRAVIQAKEKGRNRIELRAGDVPLDTQKAKALGWLDFLSQCLKNPEKRIVTHYQRIMPLNHLRDGSMDETPFYEALARFIDSDSEPVPPVKFIYALEQYGMTTDLDHLMTKRAINTLQSAHQKQEKLKLSVNLSYKTIEDESFLKTIGDILERTRLPKGMLVFEFTETSILRDLEQVRTFMRIFRGYGVSFALDDCGMGYSSLNTIRHLDLDYLKIDGSFVRRLMDGDHEDEAIVQALHDIAQKKGVVSVGEMVETAAVAERLKKMGVHYGQGYYFSKPSALLE